MFCFSGFGCCAKSAFSLFCGSFFVDVALHRIYKIRRRLLEYFLQEKSYFICFMSYDIFVTKMEIGQMIFCTPYDIFAKNGN